MQWSQLGRTGQVIKHTKSIISYFRAIDLGACFTGRLHPSQFHTSTAILN